MLNTSTSLASELSWKLYFFLPFYPIGFFLGTRDSTWAREENSMSVYLGRVHREKERAAEREEKKNERERSHELDGWVSRDSRVAQR